MLTIHDESRFDGSVSLSRICKVMCLLLFFLSQITHAQALGPDLFPASDTTQGLWIFGSSYPPDTFTGGGGAAAVLNNVIYTLWMSNTPQSNPSRYVGGLAIQTNSNGSQTFDPTSPNFGMQYPFYCGSQCPYSDSQAQVTVWNGQVYGAYRAIDTHQLVLVHNIGINGGLAVNVLSSITTGKSPAIASYKGVLYIAFQQSDSSNTLVIGKSTDGIHFTLTQYPQFQLGAPPAMVDFQSTIYGDKLVIAYRSTSSSRYLQVLNSTDGSNFTLYQNGNIQMNTLSPPGLANCVNYSTPQLCLAYININTNDVYTTGSKDGYSFATTPLYQSALGKSSGGPMLVQWKNWIFAFYQTPNGSGGNAQVSADLTSIKAQ